MNALFNILTKVVLRKVASDALKATAPKTEVVAQPKRNLTPYFMAGAAALTALLGWYSGQLDANTALTILGSIDFSTLLGN